jgi:hypothetical protein
MYKQPVVYDVSESAPLRVQGAEEIMKRYDGGNFYGQWSNIVRRVKQLCAPFV